MKTKKNPHFYKRNRKGKKVIDVGGIRKVVKHHMHERRNMNLIRNKKSEEHYKTVETETRNKFL